MQNQTTEADPTEAGTGAAQSARPPLRRIVQAVLALLLLVFVYHLVADRFTPYTSQATVDGFLVQIAPEVSGPVVSVEVRDNHAVRAGQVLFRLDPLPFEIALRAAQANRHRAVAAPAGGAGQQPAVGQDRAGSRCQAGLVRNLGDPRPQ